MTRNANNNTTLIAAITPYFLERGALWFTEHAAEIRNKVAGDPWWRDHTFSVEVGARLPFSPFLRKLADMGYVKVGQTDHHGEFATRGGIVDVFPINLAHPIRIEFSGNTLERILPILLAEEPKPIKRPQPKTASEYERLWLAGIKPGDYLVHIDHGIGIFRGMTAENQILNPKPETLNHRTIPNEVRLECAIPHFREPTFVFRRGIGSGGTGSSPTSRSLRSRKLRDKSQTLKSKFQKNLGFRVSDLEFYVLEYAPARRGGMPDRLLVPRKQVQKLSRYIGFETPAIHRLGGMAWDNTTRRAREDARKLAQELIELYRSRATASRQPYPRHADIERHLSHSFPYDETEDQKRAILEIHEDLSAERPMDRLLLGDVGFGKTEVAIRAAARAAYSGKQVALLAPTTILADQHFSTFRERLAGLPLEVAMLSRLTPKRGTKQIIENIRNGNIDIVIGTHRLLSRDVVFRDMCLVIIDEEQRFGVRHKESFKQLRSEIDILSLSATPIPRTLSLALAKFRDISLIQEPPAGRLPIRTFVLPYSERIAAEAIAAERTRGGQIFYLWNRIENIEAVRRDVEGIAHDSRIAILHGRMRETELIRTMHEFRSGRIDILLATTIIENGLDLPSVNTLIVANASRLGLAQAYQIRGRIGRGDKPAYAYFLYPTRSLTEKGKLRLKALKEAEGLGAGFQIALKDLEIRGAGNVLGKQQSGTMNRVGLNLYAQLLGEALEDLNGQ